MYRGLYDIPWADLKHAQGSAENLPTIFESMGALDLETRTKALDALAVLLWNDGQLCSAAPHAVKVFCQALGMPMQLDKPRICQILESLGQGYSYHREMLSQAPEQAADVDDIHGRIAREEECVAKTRQAVLAGLPQYLALLNARLGLERIGVLSLLTSLEECRQEVFEALMAAHPKEEEPLVRAGLLMAPVFMGMRDGAWLEQCHALLDSVEPLDSLAAAAALALVQRHGAHAAVFSALDRWRQSSQRVQDYEHLPWVRINTEADIASMMLLVLPGQKDQTKDMQEALVASLVSALAECQGVRAISLAAQILAILFAHHHDTLSSLGASSLERRFLEHLAQRPELWDIPGELMQLLSQRGLPSFPNDLQEALGLPVVPEHAQIPAQTYAALGMHPPA